MTLDEDITASVSTDDDTDVLTYEFSKDFPEIRKHEQLYEAEIQKLIENMEIDSVCKVSRVERIRKSRAY